MDISRRNTEQLKCIYRELYHCVYIAECYGPHDIQYMLAIESELAKRGITIDIEDRVNFYDEKGGTV